MSPKFVTLVARQDTGEVGFTLYVREVCCETSSLVGRFRGKSGDGSVNEVPRLQVREALLGFHGIPWP